jgi:hypothetical protein
MNSNDEHKQDGTLDLDALVDRLQERLEKRGGDAIDALLRGGRRTTSIRRLNDHEAVRRFRQELGDGLIRVDTARRLLGLIRTVMDAAMKA